MRMWFFPRRRMGRSRFRRPTPNAASSWPSALWSHPAGLTPAWRQITDVARLMGANWNYASAAEVMEEIGEVIDFYGGANYQNLACEYRRQWPCTKENPLGTERLFCETDGKSGFKFVAVPRPALRRRLTSLQPFVTFPFTLVFGHTSTTRSPERVVNGN